MSRQVLKEAGEQAADRWDDAAARFGEAFERFRESRLYVQIVLSAVLVGVTAAVSLLPVGPMRQVRDALTWVATHDYDFPGQATRVNQWARGRGGWGKALASVWTAGVGRVRNWVDIPELSQPSGPTPAPSLTPSPAPAPQQQQPSSQAQQPPTDAGQASAKPVMPVGGGIVLFGFGWPPPGAGDEMHDGIDLAADQGAKVVAMLDGTVVKVATDPKLGQLVEVRHGNVIAVYAQVEGVLVKSGQQVRQNQPLAVVGRPAGLEKSEPPHLHLEVRTLAERNSVDPAIYLGLGRSKL